ncbi:hypothetical protein [Emticicia sp. SJ17W-69]|uniref:hypothetical protein n=1 Tax=Emticicia sp. SJ17W-69 TaxID=3421657 RepID=UPI003EB7E5A0
MVLRKIYLVSLTSFIIQVSSFSQEIDSEFILNEIKVSVQNDPKKHLKEKFDDILDFKGHYDLKERAEYSDNELKKYLGDLWVLKYQYKISEDKTLLKPILVKSLAINESIYDFANRENDYLINYLKVMPEDSIFSESFLPIIITWSRDVNDLCFQYFKNMSLKSSKNKYFRDMITYRRFLQSIENLYLSDFCTQQWNDLKGLDLDIESNADLFGRLTSLENDKIYELLEDNSYYDGKCRDSLLVKYTNKLLSLDKQKIEEISITFFKRLLTIYGIKNLPEKELEKYLITRVKWRVINYMNNISWNIYQEDMYTDLSLKLINTAIKIKEEPEYFDTKAHILNRLKKYDEAIQAEERAILLCGKCKNIEEYKKTLRTKLQKK